MKNSRGDGSRGKGDGSSGKDNGSSGGKNNGRVTILIFHFNYTGF